MSDRPPIYGQPVFGNPFNTPFGSPFAGKGGFTPKSIADLALWLDSLHDASGSLWKDQSGNGNDAVQADTDKQPTIGTINGKPSLAFDGTDDDFTIDVGGSTSSLDLNGSFTAYFLGRPAVAGFLTMFSKNGNNGYRWIWQAKTPPTGGVGTFLLGAGTGGSISSQSNGITVNEVALVEIHYQVESPKLINFTNFGAPMGTDTSLRPDITINTANMFIGSTPAIQFFQGQMGQILIFDRLLERVERNQVGNFLANQYGLTWTDITFTPPEITGLVLWLDAERGVSPASGNTAAWLDQSGNGNDAAQATEADKPVFNASGINSKPSITFDAANTEDMDIVDSNSLDLTGNFTAYCVCKPATFADTTIIHKGNAIYTWQLAADAANGTQKVKTEGMGPVVTTTESDANAITPAQEVILEVQHEIGGVTKFCRFTKSGVSMGDIFPTGADMLTSNVQMFLGSVGGSEYFDGEIGQVLLYNRLLSIGERNQVGNYLAGRYGLTWTDVVAPAFVPTDLSGLVGWWDANFGVNIVSSPDVQAWADRSGNNNEVSQDVSADRRPHFNATGINGKPSLTFDGTDDELTILNAAITGLNFTGPFTIYVVNKVTDLTDFRTMFSKNTNEFRFLYNISDGKYFPIINNSNILSTSGTLINADNITELHYDVSVGGVINMTQNGIDLGAQISTISTIDRSGMAPFIIGTGGFGSQQFKGEIGQLLIFDRLLTTTERNQVGNYLATLYGLTWTNV